jgi:hypothetical protein
MSDYFLPFFLAAFFLAAISHSPPFDARERVLESDPKSFSHMMWAGLMGIEVADSPPLRHDKLSLRVTFLCRYRRARDVHRRR